MSATDQPNPLGEMAPAWVKALNELSDVTRDHVADTGSYKYRYADLATACKQAREVLSKHGIAVQQFAHCEQVGTISVTTTAWHESGQSIQSPPLAMPAKGGPQDVGSAISYARRYSLMSFLGLATDDDDGAGAQAAVAEADKPHPLSDRVGSIQKEMKALTDTDKQAMKEWADGRKMNPHAMLTSEEWLAHCEAWIDERKASE